MHTYMYIHTHMHIPAQSVEHVTVAKPQLCTPIEISTICWSMTHSIIGLPRRLLAHTHSSS